MDASKLKEVLDLHMKWLRGAEGGVRANLSYANLSYANLSYADLRYANLSYANLRSADLRYANLSYAKGVDEAHLRRKQIVPEVGPFTGFKKLADNVVAQLEITGERVGGVL